jgi:dTDP-4-amino-4,6-dideoxygalactose transaminase
MLQSNLRPFDKPIYVTRPFLPSIEEYSAGLQEIWDNQWLTNNGPVLQRFTRQLSNNINTENVCLFSNGTLALQLGLKELGISGEVITTPFTFVATSHALICNNIRPIFVDIEPDYYTLDPEKVEAAITPLTSAILAVHVFGYPCKVKELADIARRRNLKLIYDAAHAFGVEIDGKSIALHGDMSMFSFHATKLYHSIEGGMLTFQNSGSKQILNYLKNFGIKNETEVVMPGTNAKMNEFQALMGILVLKHIDSLIQKGQEIETIYRTRLADVPGIRFSPSLPPNIRFNYGYMPIEIDKKEFGMSRDRLHENLKKFNIITRRYFYPLVSDYVCYRNIKTKDPLTVAREVTGRILTLPTYYRIESQTVERICDIIIEIQNSNNTLGHFIRSDLEWNNIFESLNRHHA